MINRSGVPMEITNETVAAVYLLPGTNEKLRPMLEKI